MTPTDLLTETKIIQDYLELTVSDDMEEVVERLTTLAVYNARSGQMLADARYYMNKTMKSEIMQMLEIQTKGMGIASNVQNQLCRSMAATEQRLVDQIERINRATVHQIDLYRSILSYRKEEMRISPNINH